MNNLSLIKLLCYSGLIPFYLLSILSIYLKQELILDLFSLYSLVILSFLLGSTWLQLIIYEYKDNLKLTKILVVLYPIFLIIFEILIKFEIKIFLYALSYFIILLLDQRFLKNNEYLKIRKNLTILVIIPHIILLFNIYSNSI